jgi:hypothetical protein
VAARGFRTIRITFKGSQVSVYASKRTADALNEIEKDMALYHGVKLHQVLEAVYRQGVKDGRAEVFANIDKGVADAKKVLPFRRPGRPRRRPAA